MSPKLPEAQLGGSGSSAAFALKLEGGHEATRLDLGLKVHEGLSMVQHPGLRV